MWWRWWENPAVKDLRPAAPAPKASLTAVFRVSALSYTRIRTHLDFLGRGFDLDHIPPTKTDPCGSVLLVEMVCFPNSLFPLILLCFRPVSFWIADQNDDYFVYLNEVCIGRFLSLSLSMKKGSRSFKSQAKILVETACWLKSTNLLKLLHLGKRSP